MALIRIAALADVPSGALREVRLGERSFAVCNLDGDVRVFDGVCPCAGGPLGFGKVFDGVLVCPWHGMRYDLNNGACVIDSKLAVRRYAAHVEDGEILIELSDAEV